MVLDRGQGLRPERDYAFEQATWGLQATPVLGVVALVFGAIALGRFVRRTVKRLSSGRNL